MNLRGLTANAPQRSSSIAWKTCMLRQRQACGLLTAPARDNRMRLPSRLGRTPARLVPSVLDRFDAVCNRRAQTPAARRGGGILLEKTTTPLEDLGSSRGPRAQWFRRRKTANSAEVSGNGAPLRGARVRLSPAFA